MNLRYKITGILALAVLVFFVAHALTISSNEKKQFEKKNALVASYGTTSLERINKSVITLPDGDVLVQLINGKGTYGTEVKTKTKGTVSIDGTHLVTKFVSGIFGKKEPHMDALVPMYVTGDAKDGSMYVVLFNDRGDATIEKSHVRLGGEDVVIETITTIPPDTKNSLEEYRADIQYKLVGRMPKTNQLVSLPREVILPVIDGHFDGAGMIFK